jgi:tetratricopeptide (TPR) repeat protein
LYNSLRMTLIVIDCQNKGISRYTKLLPWIALLLLAIYPTKLKAAFYEDAPKTFLLFKPVANTPVAQRVQKASDIYKANCRHLNEATAMSVLDSVELLAQSLDDNGLECSVNILRADYYSVNRGYNQLSIDYHQRAIDYAIAHDMPVETAMYLHKKGLYYFTFSRNREACQYFLQAYDDFKKLGFKNVPDISRYLAEQGYFYYALRDYDTANPLLHLALSNPIDGIRIRINLITTIGLIHRNYRQFPQALDYFNRALKLAATAKDSAWIAITTGNIGSVYFMQGHYQEAIPNLLVDYQASVKYQQFNNAATTLLRLSYINLQYNQLKQAQVRIDSAALLIKDSKEDVLGTWVEIYNQRTILAQKNGQLNEVIVYSKKYEAARDSFAQRDNIAAVERVKLKWETEKYKNQIELLHSQTSIRVFKRNAVICILFLVMVIVALIFNKYRLNVKRDQEQLQIKKRRVDEKLKDAAESLQLYTENLKQSNALIERFKAEIEQFKTQSTDRAGAEKLEKLMHAHIMTDETWDEFKKLFTKVHSGFFIKLRNSFPYLTDTDTRLLSLIKLGLNNREMSNMLGITIEGIKKSKQRLRKKMQIAPETDIEQVIAEL